MYRSRVDIARVRERVARARLVAAVLLVTVPLGRSIEAGPLDRYGVGATTSEVAGVSALGTDVTAAAHNPAIAARVIAGAAFNLELSWFAVGVTLAPRPSSADISGVINGDAVPPGGWRADSLRPLPTEQLAPRGAESVSPSHRLMVGGTSTIIERRLHLGFVAELPLEAIQRVDLPIYDERAQFFDNRLHWFYLGGAQSSISMATALAVELAPTVRVGSARWLDQSVTSEVSVFLPDVLRPEETLQRLETRVVADWTPTFGVSGGPWRGTTIELALHGERGTTIVADSRVRTRSPELDGEQREVWTAGFVPRRAELSAAWHSPSSRLAVGASAIARQWSRFRGNGVARGALDDTVEGRLGGRYRFADGWSIAGGGAYAPTPVPEQTGRTNLVDNDRITVATGLRWKARLAGRNWVFGLAMRMTRLIPFEHTKRQGDDAVFDEFPDSIDINGEPVPDSAGFQSNNPGFPSYRSDGWAGAASLTGAVSW